MEYSTFVIMDHDAIITVPYSLVANAFIADVILYFLVDDAYGSGHYGCMERVFKCLELIHELQRSAAVQSVPQNPIGVLDVTCLSYKSDELPAVSSANSSQADSDFKRVNLNKPFDMD
ncbi:hypothetical protein GIB67_039624 [Kingdonia uniflora]|uniref:Uncharacterized protein n=1 Tax=Kingdonia uniflora TaxID=39325 RepID=A0A7J7MDH9_9MAGN|nr:hypothetical protein GIB67_039624 [Kingdonia uniflora]